MRAKLLALAYTIGRELRTDNGPSYPHALEMLGDIEDLLKDYAHLPLSGRSNGYLPARHPGLLRGIPLDFTSQQSTAITRFHKAIGRHDSPLRQPSPYSQDKSERDTVETVVRRFLRYSFEGIDYDYDALTERERRLCTRAEFSLLLVWLGREDK